MNKELAKEKNIQEDDQQKIIQLHSIASAALKAGYVLYNTDRITEENRKIILDELTDTEFKLQRLWKFDENKDYHRYDLELKGCTCQKYDNADMIRTGRKLVNHTCPWHKWSQKDVKEIMEEIDTVGIPTVEMFRVVCPHGEQK